MIEDGEGISPGDRVGDDGDCENGTADSNSSVYFGHYFFSQ